jgi:hypothetical protein
LHALHCSGLVSARKIPCFRVLVSYDWFFLGVIEGTGFDTKLKLIFEKKIISQHKEYTLQTAFLYLIIIIIILLKIRAIKNNFKSTNDSVPLSVVWTKRATDSDIFNQTHY